MACEAQTPAAANATAMAPLAAFFRPLIMSTPVTCRSAIALFCRIIVLVIEKVRDIPVIRLRHIGPDGDVRGLKPTPQIAFGRALAVEHDVQFSDLQSRDLTRRQGEGAGNL